MASIQEAIKRLAWMFTSEGADKVVSDMNKVGDATASVAVKSQTTEKSALDLEKSFNSLERRFSSTIRAQQDYSAVQAKVNAAVAQHPELQERANATLERAKEHFEHASGGASGFAKATEIARESMIGFAIEGGAVGAILGSFGPWGIAAAGAITVLREAFDSAIESAKQFGERALQIRTFADATGATTTEVRGLAEAGEKAGVGGDRMKVAFERLSVNLAEARTKSGELYEGIQAINPELAEEIANTRKGAEAWDLLGRALDKTTDSTLKAKIARTAFGRGGVELIPALAETTKAGGIKEYAEEVQHATGVTDELTRATAAQVAEIESLKKLAADTFASIYSEAVLHRMEQAAKYELQIAQAAKAASQSGSTWAPSTDEFGNPFDFTLLNQNKASAKAAGDGHAAHADDGHAAPASGGHDDGGHGAATTAIKAETAATEALTKSRLDALEAEKGAAGETARLVSNLGGAATGAEIAAANFHKLTAAYLANRFGAVNSAEAIEKYNRALHGDTENVIAALQDQRSVIEAIGGSAKMTAQYAADYAAALRSGKEPADALAIAAEKFANAQASANTAAKIQLQTLQDNLAVASAITGQEQMTAQAALTLNNLLRDGVNQETAMEVAAQQVTNATAAASAAVLKQVEALKDQNEMIKAAKNGTEAQTAAAIAYKNAIATGASESSAAALSAQMLANSMAKAAASAEQWTQQIVSGNAGLTSFLGNFGSSVSWQQGQSQAEADNAQFQTGGSAFAPSVMTQSGAFGGDGTAGVTYRSGQGRGTDLNGSYLKLAALQKLFAEQDALNTPDNIAQKYVAQGNYAGAISAVEKSSTGGTDADRMALVDSLTQVLNSQTADKGTQTANVQKELAWLNTLPQTIARDQKIASLQQSIDQLKSSTDSLTAANRDLLSPYYTQDPRTSHIGFRSQGMAFGGYVDVPGAPSANDNMIAQIPVASGERIYVDPMSSKRGVGGGTTQNFHVVNNVTIGGNADKGEVKRTFYQLSQGMAKQIAAGSR